MGIHINGDHNSVNVVHGDVIYGGDHNGYGESSEPPVGLVGLFAFVLILVALAIKFWWIVLIAAGVVVAIRWLWLVLQRNQRAEVEARRQREALAARAEHQNSAYLQGDPYGMFGRFPPG